MLREGSEKATVIWAAGRPRDLVAGGGSGSRVAGEGRALGVRRELIGRRLQGK